MFGIPFQTLHFKTLECCIWDVKDYFKKLLKGEWRVFEPSIFWCIPYLLCSPFTKFIPMSLNVYNGLKYLNLKVCVSLKKIYTSEKFLLRVEKWRPWQLTWVIMQHNLLFSPFFFFQNLGLNFWIYRATELLHRVTVLRQSYCNQVSAWTFQFDTLLLRLRPTFTTT